VTQNTEHIVKITSAKSTSLMEDLMQRNAQSCNAITLCRRFRLLLLIGVFPVQGCYVLSTDLTKPSKILSDTMLRIKTNDRTITVPGAARRRVVSDWVIWRGQISIDVVDTVAGYRVINSEIKKLERYLANKGISQKETSKKTVTIEERYDYEIVNNERRSKRTYRMAQAIEVQSTDFPKIEGIANSAPEIVIAANLREGGVKFEAAALQYVFAHLEDIKDEVLTAATKNARQRAMLIAKTAGKQLGSMLSAQLGDIQILSRTGLSPASSRYESYSDDVSSREKDVIANIQLIFVLE
jgi:uncharacterized protein